MTSTHDQLKAAIRDGTINLSDAPDITDSDARADLIFDIAVALDAAKDAGADPEAILKETLSYLAGRKVNTPRGQAAGLPASTTSFASARLD